MDTREIIATIIAERKDKGLTQSELAKKAHISRRSIIDMESGPAGKHDIGLRKLQRILSTLGLEITLRKASARPTESELAEMFKDDDE